ncbi:MAG: glycosyltransferase [Rhodocyclales bacterium]|nr:glycosyltransferase [Rhodocyclales bacterium]
MRFSVIVPTLDRADLLKKVLLALKDQSFNPKKFEIVIVDNGSRDSTRDVVHEFERISRVPVIFCHETRRGLHWARHTGAFASQGEILAYIDDDAIPDANWLEELDKAYLHFGADCAGGRIDIKWDRQPPQWVIPYEHFLGRIDYGTHPRILSETEFINGGNFTILRRRLFEIGGFNPDQVNRHLIGDGESGLCLRIHKRKWKMVWVPDATVLHMQFVDRNGTLQDLKRRYWNNGVCKAYNNYRNFRPSSPILVIYSACKGISSMVRSCIATAFRVQGNLSKYHLHELTSAYFAGEAQYYWRLAHDGDFRRLALLEDWINLTQPNLEVIRE